MPLIDPKLKAILVCPVSYGPLEEDEERGYLLCRESNLAYPVREGIPIMLPEEAVALDKLTETATSQ